MGRISQYCKTPAFNGDTRFCFCSDDGGQLPGPSPTSKPTILPGECRPGEEPSIPTKPPVLPPSAIPNPNPTRSPTDATPTLPPSGTPTTGECPAGASQMIIDAGDMPRAPVVGYVGGSNWDSAFKWDDLERTVTMML